LFPVWAFVWGNVDPHGGGLGAGFASLRWFICTQYKFPRQLLAVNSNPRSWFLLNLLLFN